tara:strand:+ start:9128 stop:9916 length:789 start_codon:yes stop_codon:yes gene_type:complete
MLQILKFQNQLIILSYKRHFRKVAGSAIEGINHEKLGLKCQDYVHCFHYKDLSLISLSDGAGSYRHSALGAKLACEFTGNYFKDNYQSIFKKKDTEIKNDFIKNLQKALFRSATKNNLAIRQLSSTLLFIVMYNEQYILGHIGDGVIGLNHKNSPLVLSKPKNAEYANQTFFTTSKNIKTHFELYKRDIDFENNSGFILMSDGTAKSLYDFSTNKFSLGVKKLFEWIKFLDEKEMKNLLYVNQKNVFRKKTIDDCSIVMMTF